MPHSIFWIRLETLVILDVIFGYLLQDLGHHSVLGCLLFFIALGYFFICFGRWLLAAVVLLKTAPGFLIDANPTALAVFWPFLIGGIILDVLKRELSEANQICYRSSLFDSQLFGVLVVLA